MKIVVQTSNEECQIFRKKKIVDTLLRETDIKEAEALKIARSVERQVKRITDQIITTSQIRELVNAQLLRRGDVNSARQHERVGIPVNEIKRMIEGHITDNANIGRNPEAVHKFLADSGFKQYVLMSLPPDLAQAHNKGDLHIHDLEYFAARPLNCLQSDLRWFIRNGTRVDGSGEHTSAAGPAKNVETLVNHAGQILMAAQVYMSGGQSLSLLNVFMAPFVKGLPYERVKQAVQMFVFNLNMSYVSRGGQAVFSSINLEFTVPDFLKNEPAYGPGGKVVGTYGDYEDEVRILNRAFIEVLTEGDYMGKFHLFPNTIWMLRKEMMKSEFEEDLLAVHQLSSKFSTPYFGNCFPKWTGGHSNIMGCRTRLNANWTGDWDLDTLRTGNLAYVTINLPRIAYKTGDGEYYDELNKVLGLAEEILLLRRQQALKCFKTNLLPFLAQTNKEGEMYYRIENATISFGFIGMNEALKAMNIEDGIVSKDGQKMAKNILQYMNEYTKDLTNETGYRWTILQTPAETTAHRFAMLDMKKYPRQAIVSGDEESYYYTNSSHVPVDESRYLIPEKIKIESQFHPLTSGGHIFHAFMGESFSDPEGMMSLTKKIVKTDLGFWAYTNAFSFCFNCNTMMKGLEDNCSNCGSSEDVEQYSRITGYMQQVGRKKNSSGGWNSGKRQELKDRFNHGVLE